MTLRRLLRVVVCLGSRPTASPVAARPEPTSPVVEAAAVAALGRLGRSQGCPALDRAVARRVIELIRDGTALFAYHPSAPRGSRLAAR